MKDYLIYSTTGTYIKSVRGILEMSKFVEDANGQTKIVDEEGIVLALIPNTFLIIKN